MVREVKHRRQEEVREHYRVLVQPATSYTIKEAHTRQAGWAVWPWRAYIVVARCLAQPFHRDSPPTLHGFLRYCQT